MPVPKGFRETKIKGVRCSPGSHRTKVLSKNLRLIICCPQGRTSGKPNWNPRTSRCRVGTRAVAKQKKIF